MAKEEQPSRCSRRHSSISRVVLATVLLFLLSPSTAQASSVDPTEVNQVEAVEGDTVKLMCNVTLDGLRYVLWYKDGSSQIFYVKSIQSNMSTGLNDLGVRSHFIHDQGTPYLQLETVRWEDSGMFLCRADYRDGSSLHRHSNLTVIVPPGSPTILEENGTQVETTVGPYDEGSNITLTCRVVGGEPSPQVTWWMGGAKLRGDVERRDNEVLNILHLGPLTRELFNVIYNCQAINSPLVTPLNKGVALDINLKPLSVEVVGPREPLVAGKENEITCLSTGGRPPAVLTWSLDGETFENDSLITTETSSNKSVSRLTFVPETTDSGKKLICQALSPKINHSPIKDIWTLNVEYAPMVSLKRLAPPLPLDVREGINVSFHCNVEANPAAETVAWFHKGLKLRKSVGYSTYKNRLRIRNVQRHHNGIYSCIATNKHGSGRSQPVMLDVMYLPLCSSPTTVSLGAGMQDRVNLTCHMKSSPAQVFFHWYVNTTGSLIPISTEHYTTQDQTSILNYAVENQQDYGQVLCYAENKLGNTTQPCHFRVVPAGKPDPLENCTVTNQTTDTLFAKCTPGYDGGLKQHFVVLVYENLGLNKEKRMLHNLTEVLDPTFTVGGLNPGSSYILGIYSENEKGRSTERQIHGFTMLPSPESPPHNHILFPITPILGVLIGVIGALVLVAIVVVVVMKLRGDARRDRMNQGQGHDSKKPPHTPLNTAKDGEDGPDVILCRADSAYEDVDGIPQKLKHVNIYEVPYDSEVAAKKSEGSNEDEVEYAELTFSNGKSRPKGNKKSGGSGANGTIRSPDDATIYATIDHTRTAAQQRQVQQANKAGKQVTIAPDSDSAGQREPDEIPLMDAALESSV